ncbi:hypothetical protein BDW72DRAFT_175303 [Aspergillus terricola var. indicus]
MDKTSRFTGQSCIYVAFLASKCFPCLVNTCGLFSSTRSCKVLFLLLLCSCLRHCAALLSSFALDRLSLCCYRLSCTVIADSESVLSYLTDFSCVQ